MEQLTFTGLHCWLMRNGFGFYVVSFISMIVYGVYRRTIYMNIIELSAHAVLLLLMGRMVLLVAEASSAQYAGAGARADADASAGLDAPAPLSPVLSSIDFVTIGLLFCFASNIASFLFGVSLGKKLDEANADAKSDAVPGAETKGRWNKFRKFVLKPKVSLAKNSSSNLVATAAMQLTPASKSPQTNTRKAIKLYTIKAQDRDTSAMGPMEITIEKSKQTILSVLNFTETSRYKDLPLSIIRQTSSPDNGFESTLFKTEDKSMGVYLTGSCHTYLSPEDVLTWLKQSGFTTGFESLAPEQEINLQQKSKKLETTVRRLVSKPASMMSSRRDFVVVTSISKLQDAGAYIIASRSMPEDFQNLANGTGSKRKGGCIRAIVYGSGWVLHPWSTGDCETEGCEISYACHLDMMGSPTSGVNAAKLEILADRIKGIFEFISAVDDVSTLRLTKPDPHGISLVSSPRAKQESHTFDMETETADDALNSAISAESKTMLLGVAKDALEKLRRLHGTYRPIVQPSEAPNESWDIFHEEGDGVTVGELRTNTKEKTPVGILTATCTTEAPPHVVRKLLMDHPKEVDTLLEGRTILSKLDQQSYIQWLAYGTIWPIGARDFLLVTTEDVFDESTGDGFVIASTSIDHLCEIEGEVKDLNDSGDKAEPSYVRSSLKLAGYVGVRNAQGGTDVSLFVDVDVYAYIPAWLLQVLAKYGLSEMMNRIKRSTMGHPQLSFRNDITRMLSRIESTEAKMRSYVQDHNLPVPKDAAFLFMDGGETASLGSAVMTAPASPEGNRRRTLQRSETEFSHAPVPSVAEARHRRSSIRRASVIGSPAGAPGDKYEEFFDCTNALVAEAKHLLKVYLGLEQQGDDEVPLGLDWKEKKREKTVVVSGTSVTGNTWNAVRAVGCVRASKEEILKLLLNDQRIGEFDDMFDNCTVRSTGQAVIFWVQSLCLFFPRFSLSSPLFPFSLYPAFKNTKQKIIKISSFCTKWAIVSL